MAQIILPICGEYEEARFKKMDAKFKYYDKITDDKKREMEGEIRGSYEEAKRALEKERKFIEDTSHYFFNPICVAKGYLISTFKGICRKKREGR